jgi:hypothetical protein
MDESTDLPKSILFGAGCATALLGSGLAFVMMRNKTGHPTPIEEVKVVVVETLDKTVSSVNYVCAISWDIRAE